jgi:glyceraldehyde 3-phosphate dehydrogenase
MLKVAINGFGRIGRTFFRQAFGRQDIKIVAINDLTDEENLAYLLKYDTVYGRYNKQVSALKEGDKNYLLIDDKKIPSFTEKDPVNLPWKELEVDVVIESTGFFTDEEGAKKHLQAGAKRVVVSAPGKGNIEQAVCGANEDRLTSNDLGQITSNASCTTNAVVPVAAILMEKLGVKKALLNTIHAYTSSQAMVDSPDAKDFRRGRAGAQNIVPASTGAAKATAKSLLKYENIFDGIAIRVPVPSGSIIDFTFVSKKKTSIEEVNEILTKAAEDEKWQNILKVNLEPLVSSDIIGQSYASIVDLSSTRVVDGDLVKVLSWYDNEWGYSHTLLMHVLKVGNLK